SPVADHLVQQWLGNKHRRLIAAKTDVRACADVNAPEELGVEVGRPQLVEALAELRYHFECDLHQEIAGAHDLAIVGPDIEPSPNDIDMRRRGPLSPRMRSIRVAESHMHAGYFFVLQNVANN